MRTFNLNEVEEVLVADSFNFVYEEYFFRQWIKFILRLYRKKGIDLFVFIISQYWKLITVKISLCEEHDLDIIMLSIYDTLWH